MSPEPRSQIEIASCRICLKRLDELCGLSMAAVRVVSGGGGCGVKGLYERGCHRCSSDGRFGLAGGWRANRAKPDAIGNYGNPADRRCDADHADRWLDDQRAVGVCDERGDADGGECGFDGRDAWLSVWLLLDSNTSTDYGCRILKLNCHLALYRIQVYILPKYGVSSL